MSSLYSKYRPLSFSDIIGQDHIINLIKAEIKSNSISHAYIFIGPRGTGKTTTARVFSKAVNCLNINEDGSPCLKCANCKKIAEGKFLDLIEIDAASNRGIDEIREIKEKIEFLPVEGRYKIYIIDEVHMLTKEAFNALLKTLEEPPNHIIFILATTEPQKIPATILSRCEKYDFRLGNDNELGSRLRYVIEAENCSIEPEALTLIVKKSNGSYRDALSILDTVISREHDGIISYDEVRASLGLPDETMVYYYIFNSINGNEVALYTMLEEIFAKGIHISQFIKSVILQLRDILVSHTRGGIEGYEFMSGLSRSIIIKLIAILFEAHNSQKNAFDPKLPLQLATAKILELCSSQKFSNLGAEKIKQSGGTEADNGVANRNIPAAEEKVVAQDGPINSGTSNVKASKSVDEITIETVKQKWRSFINALKPYNSHLYAFMLQATPIEVLNNKDVGNSSLRLGVKFEFHKKKIEDIRSQTVLQSVSAKLFNIPIRVFCTVGETVDCRVEEVTKTVTEPKISGCNTGESNPEHRGSEERLENVFNDVFGDTVC